MRVFPALMLLASVCPAAPVPKVKAELYFPTTVGTKSVFKVADSVTKTEFEQSNTVTEVEEKDGTRRVTVAYTLNARAVDKAVWVVTTDGVAVEYPPSEDRRRSKHLDLSVKVGGTWEEEFETDSGKERAVYTRGKEEEVEVPAGKFQAVRVDVVHERPRFQQTTRSTYWMAPGVDRVKTVSSSGARPNAVTTTELTSFTPGK